ncbi:MAG: hypothetical protein RR232_03450 [Clostridia bacterium]
MNPKPLLAIWLLCVLMLCGCIRTAPLLVSEITLAPTAAPTIAPTSTPTPVATVAPTPMLNDALGNFVADPQHFRQYITFKNIQIYEQCDDTFMDAIAINAYPQNLVCAVDVVFYMKDEEVARAKVQSRDAQYLLTLVPGENTIFAQIDTDMTLTSLDFKLIYDDKLVVLPE